MSNDGIPGQPLKSPVMRTICAFSAVTLMETRLRVPSFLETSSAFTLPLHNWSTASEFRNLRNNASTENVSLRHGIEWVGCDKRTLSRG
jgi:hypothetical protein